MVLAYKYISTLFVLLFFEAKFSIKNIGQNFLYNNNKVFSKSSMDNKLKYIFLKTNFLNNKTNSLLLLFLLSILEKNIQYIHG